MKKALSALTTLAALTVTAVAVGQEPSGGGPTPTPHDTPNPPPPAASAPGAGLPNVPGPAAELPPVSPIAPEAPAAEKEPARETSLTAADVGAAAPAPPPRETITVRQTYRPNRPLLYTGGSMLISSYVITAAFTGLQNVRDANGDQPTYIPVAGPWMYLANSNMTVLDQALLAGSGVAQGAGLVIGVLSFIVPERVPAATVQAGAVNVHVAATPAGIQAFGQF